MRKHVWIEDIIYCPSQIYYYFVDTAEKHWCAYIRQRGGPVTVELVELDDLDNFPNFLEGWHKITLDREYDINNKKTEEEEDKEIIEIERKTLDLLRINFPAVIFPDNPPRLGKKY